VIVVRGATAITMDSERRIVPNADIVIDGRHITAVAEGAGSGSAGEVIDARGMVAIPGLIDTHAHADQSLLRGLGDDLHWIPFLCDRVHPFLASRTPDDVVTAYRLSMLEMLRAGTTCFVSPNVSAGDDLERIGAAVAETGLRAVLARYVTPAGDTEGGDNAADGSLAAAVDAARTWSRSGGALAEVWFGPHTPRMQGETAAPTFYQEVRSAARELGTRLVYHFCSEREDAEFYRSEFGVPPIEWALEHDLLGEDVLLINCCQATAGEIDLLASTSTHVAHSPVANMKMATGIAPLAELLGAGVNVSLGTDGAANNNSSDMLGEMKAACLLANASGGHAGSLTALQALELATLNGARAIGREHELGSLEPGKLADLVLVDLAMPNTTPVLDPVSNVVFAAHPGNVDSVIIDGRVLMRGRTIQQLDERAILVEAQRTAERLARSQDLLAKGVR
jgi:cytosine/adenosine deaminase-related metal-dependent hydrolase